MTPYEYKKHVDKQKEEAQKRAEQWHIPLYSNGKKLKSALRSMKSFRLDPEDVPFLIRLIENPKSPLCEFGILPGCVDLFTHDCIHVILGRGVLPKDEAFVIGFTMGSTQKMGWLRERVFLFFARWFYPEGYRFYKEEREVFRWGLIAGQKCKYDLTKVDFSTLRNKSISSIRNFLGVDTKFVKVCYLLEKKAFKDSRESQRLL
jgi:hypothetical protein